MSRYDDDDSEYVVYGNMSSAGNSEETDFQKLCRLKETFRNKYAKSEVSIDGRTTAEIETLAEILNKIYNDIELTNDDKKLIVNYGANGTLLKEDITYDDIKDLPEYQGLSNLVGAMDYFQHDEPEQVKENDIAFFSAHRQIAFEFYYQMKELSLKDNDKSLYLRLTMMAKYQQFLEGKMTYEDPKRRLYFMKTYLGLNSNNTIKSFFVTSAFDYSYSSLSSLLQGIPPKNAKDVLKRGIREVIEIRGANGYDNRIGNKQKLLPYILEIINDQNTDEELKETLIREASVWIEQNHYGRDGSGPGRFVDGTGLNWTATPYTEVEMQFFDSIDDTLLQRADTAMQKGNFELVSYISRGIINRMDEMNPKTKDLTNNQIAFYEKYSQEFIKQKDFSSLIPEQYLEKASEKNLNLILDAIKYNGQRHSFENYLIKHGISVFDASDLRALFSGMDYVASGGITHISFIDKLPDAIKEGFWIRTTEDKIRNYNKLCSSIYFAHQHPFNDEDKTKLRELGFNLLEKLKKEYPLSESDINQLDNETLLVLTFTGDVKNKKIHIQDSSNKIEEILIQTGYLKLSAKSQVTCSPVSQYCDINETWDEYDYKTNLLDRKLQNNKISDVIDLINRGVNVSAKVERVNRENKKFPISPFDRYISGILYRGKAKALMQLNDDMQRIAKEVNPNKLHLVNKIFNSLSFKTRNDTHVKEIEREVNNIVLKRTPNVFEKRGKEY